MDKINLENPIFVAYINVNRLSRQKRDMYVKNIQDNFVVDDAKLFVMPTSVRGEGI